MRIPCHGCQAIRSRQKKIVISKSIGKNGRNSRDTTDLSKRHRKEQSEQCSGGFIPWLPDSQQQLEESVDIQKHRKEHSKQSGHRRIIKKGMGKNNRNSVLMIPCHGCQVVRSNQNNMTLAENHREEQSEQPAGKERKPGRVVWPKSFARLCRAPWLIRGAAGTNRGEID